MVALEFLIAELAALDSSPREGDADEITELDRRYARASEGARVPHGRVVQYAFQYRYDGRTILMLRVFHGAKRGSGASAAIRRRLRHRPTG